MLVAKEVDAGVARERGKLLADRIDHAASVSDPHVSPPSAPPAALALVLAPSAPARAGPTMSLGAAEDVAPRARPADREGEDDAPPPRRLHVAAGHVAVAGSRDGADDGGARRASETSPAPRSSQASGSTSPSIRAARA